MAAVNFVGCALFGIAAIASNVVPETGSILALAPANFGTALGGLCFPDRLLAAWRRSRAILNAASSASAA